MIWLSPTNEYFEYRPTRVRLADGTTRTSEEITDGLLLSIGWQQIESLPVVETPIESNATVGSTITDLS